MGLAEDPGQLWAGGLQGWPTGVSDQKFNEAVDRQSGRASRRRQNLRQLSGACFLLGQKDASEEELVGHKSEPEPESRCGYIGLRALGVQGRL